MQYRTRRLILVAAILIRQQFGNIGEQQRHFALEVREFQTIRIEKY